jgi:hypothetical protein
MTTRLRSAVERAVDRLRLDERIATLRTDVPFDPALEPTIPDRDAITRTAALFEELEFRSLLPRLHALPDV